MTLTTSPATFDALATLRFAPEQFELVCAENREAVLELAADDHVVAITPTGSEIGSRNSELLFQLKHYTNDVGGWKAFDSSAGSVIRLDRWLALSMVERRGFAPLGPDLVVELASPSDEGPRGLSALREQMDAYQAIGARLGWLLLPP